MHCGEVIQHGCKHSFEINIIWEGNVAVCESTEYKEPIMVYKRGTALNVYQILMDHKLPFDYRACWRDEYSIGADKYVYFNRLHEERKLQIVFEDHHYKPYTFPKKNKDVLLYCVNRVRLEKLFDEYTVAHKVFLKYALKQTKQLRRVRMKGHHLNKTVR